jgi:hypothetical protein
LIVICAARPVSLPVIEGLLWNTALLVPKELPVQEVGLLATPSSNDGLVIRFVAACATGISEAEKNKTEDRNTALLRVSRANIFSGLLSNVA